MRASAVLRSRVVDVDGFQLGIHDSAGSDDGRPCIVLIHGSGGTTARHYSTLFPMLAAKYRVIGIDLASTRQGEAQGSDPVTFDELSSQIRGALVQIDCSGAVTLVGYSLGAALAIDAASVSASRISSLVLLNGFVATDAALDIRMSLLLRLLNGGDAAELVDFQLISLYSRSYLNARGSVGISAMKDAYETGPAAAAHATVCRSIDVGAQAQQLRIPTLVIGSTQDQLVPVAHSQQLYGAIDGAKYAEVDSGHASLVEKSAQVFHLIEDFVRRGQATEHEHADAYRAIRQLAGR